MVRDLARALGKEVRLEITGESTPVDRDILEWLEAPLNHLLRNAVDHGCETPAERKRAAVLCLIVLAGTHASEFCCTANCWIIDIHIHVAGLVVSSHAEGEEGI